MKLEVVPHVFILDSLQQIFAERQLCTSGLWALILILGEQNDYGLMEEMSNEAMITQSRVHRGHFSRITVHTGRDSVGSEVKEYFPDILVE